MEEREIIELYFSRNEAAIDETSCKYGSALKTISVNILNDEQEASECLNDVLYSAWNQIPPLQPDSLFAYLAKCIRNISLKRVDYHKMKKRSAELVELSMELENSILIHNSAEARIEEKELFEQVEKFLRDLKKEQRVMFVRRYWYGDSITEIAYKMGLSTSKVKTTLYRIRKKLKEYLEKEGVYL
ncbi:MAG: sigma-70 family RNA polymerase sigma factor [Lachnospiraceae bacterium]|nr:sigma-70 family RNA polymerase sigma factor [Lachnospiraceae bacterium]